MPLTSIGIGLARRCHCSCYCCRSSSCSCCCCCCGCCRCCCYRCRHYLCHVVPLPLPLCLLVSPLAGAFNSLLLLFCLSFFNWSLTSLEYLLKLLILMDPPTCHCCDVNVPTQGLLPETQWCGILHASFASTVPHIISPIIPPSWHRWNPARYSHLRNDCLPNKLPSHLPSSPWQRRSH